MKRPKIMTFVKTPSLFKEGDVFRLAERDWKVLAISRRQWKVPAKRQKKKA
jgi:hypothetical protein